MRATVSDMGPLLLSRILNLNETQEGVLTLAFKIADDNGLLLLDLKDLRALLQHVGDNAAAIPDQLRQRVGGVDRRDPARPARRSSSKAPSKFLGEPMLNVDDLLQTVDGKGVINILAADRLMQSPKVYSTLLLWLLSELYERLPEVGDRDKPKLVFFFDEAHLLFTDAPKPLLEKIEQVVRLIRSKGVGRVLRDAESARRAGHGARASSAIACSTRCARSRRATRRRSRPRPKRCARIRSSSTEAAITELGVGEGLISFLDEKGRPSDRRARLRAAAGEPHRPHHARRAQGGDRRRRPWPACTTRTSTASRPTRSSRRARRQPQRRRAGGARRDAAGRRRHDGRPEGHPVRHRPVRAAAAAKA